MQPFLLWLNSIVQAVAGIPPFVSVLALLAVFTLFLRVPLLTDLLILPYRLVAWILRGLGLFNEVQAWSVVYDSKTKLPLDPAYVTARNTLGVEVASVITDLHGRFSLLLPRGIYTLDVQKSNYAFPSLAQRVRQDGEYTNLYYGQPIDVIDTEQPVAVSIPMDPIGEDWNQQQKKSMKLFGHFNKPSEINRSEYLYMAIGLMLCGTHFLVYLDSFSLNVIFCFLGFIALYMFAYLIRPSQYAHSVVLDRTTGAPISFARISIYSAVTRQKVSVKTASLEGQFTALLSKGDYYVTIEGRNADGSYSLLHTTSPFRLEDGYLGRRFSV